MYFIGLIQFLFEPGPVQILIRNYPANTCQQKSQKKKKKNEREGKNTKMTIRRQKRKLYNISHLPLQNGLSHFVAGNQNLKGTLLPSFCSY